MDVGQRGGQRWVRARGGIQPRAAGLLLGVALAMSSARGGAAQTTSDRWDAKQTTTRNAGNTNGRIVRGAGTAIPLTIAGTFSDCSECRATCATVSSAAQSGCYRCKFVSVADSSKWLSTIAFSVTATELKCNTSAAWGETYDTGRIKLEVQREVGAAGASTSWATMGIDNLESSAYFMYLEESLFSVYPTSINSYDQTITIAGSGFGGKQYQCYTFEGSTAWTVAKTTGYVGLTGFPFTVLNRTMGTCRISSRFAAKSTFLSLLSQTKEVIDTLTAVRNTPSAGYQDWQPTVLQIDYAGGQNNIKWMGLPVTWFESWTYADPIFGDVTGGATMSISGAGFRPASEATYFCDYTYNLATNTGCDGVVDLDPQYTMSAQASTLNSSTIACITPAWNYTQFKTLSTVVSIRSDDEGAVVENGLLRRDALASVAVQSTSFDYVSTPTWSNDTVAEGTVFTEGVDCASLNLTFRASGGRSRLRLTLDYTPMIPTDNLDFLWWDDSVLSLNDVLFYTRDKKYQTFNFVDAAELDQIRSSGYCLGNLSHTLALPKGQLAEKRAKAHTYYDKTSQSFQKKEDLLGILDNTKQPSKLTLTTVTSDDEVIGTLLWNVSRGWEGYSYKLCVTARHAVASPSILVSNRFAKRCVYVVVPKCQKCYAPSDDLFSIASRYGGSWLDLWSLNRQLINTTAVNLTTDEVFNTKGDSLYPRIAVGQSIRLGLKYKLLPEDTLETVSLRFGMSLRNLMQLNPDIVSWNQNADMKGKNLCVLPDTAQYSSCSHQLEDPDPRHYEAKYRVSGTVDPGVHAADTHNARIARRMIWTVLFSCLFVCVDLSLLLCAVFQPTF